VREVRDDDRRDRDGDHRDRRVDESNPELAWTGARSGEVFSL
jgi:hypothetical protein